MSKPLIGNPDRVAEAAKFHRDVFALFGGPKKVCALCNKPGATDAAHCLSRVTLGKYRYADPRLARPLCRPCHIAVDTSLLSWPLEVRLEAVRIHNSLPTKVKLQEPVS